MSSSTAAARAKQITKAFPSGIGHSMAPPTTMKALKCTTPGNVEVQDVPVPEVKDDYILVKVKYCALNPTDWKHIDVPPIHAAGATVGCDYMGTVVQAGPNVKGNWKEGDRIAGVVHGCNKCNLSEGSFAEYALVREGGQMAVPLQLDDAEAATLGVALTTVGLTLYQNLSLPWPGSIPADCWLLVYGGSTATGSIAIQFAQLSGAKVVATASPRNREFVLSLGADEVFDYNGPDCGARIRAHTGDALVFALDCYGEEIGTKVCTESMSSRGGHISSIIPGAEYGRKEDGVRSSLVLAYKGMGEPWDFFGPNPATPEDYEFVRMWWRMAGKLIGEGKVKVHPPRVGEGFDGVIKGLDEMRKGLVSATKLVYKL